MAKDEDTTVNEVETNEESQVETPVVNESEETVDESGQQEEQSEEQSEAETEEVDEETPPISARKAKRLEKLESLVNRLKNGETSATAPKPKGLDYRTTLDADEDVIKTLETDRDAYGSTAFNAGLEQAKSMQFHTRLEIDAPKIETKYPLFDKDSEEFNPNAANAINQWYLATVGYDAQSDTVQNPGIRYSDFVEGVMELADSMAGAKVETTQRNIAKQAANTGLRPDGSSAKRLNLNKAPQDMTNEELNAVINQALPRN